jgi:chorismate synthase
MRSNRFSSQFGFTAFGESHGPAIGIVIEDIKPDIDFPFDELNRLIRLRNPGSNNYSTTRKETDAYQIISGVYDGKTTGMPICILFWNRDIKSEDYDIFKDVFRPGHADYAFFKKFKIYDYRGGGRASGRETVSRIAASAFVSEIISPVEIKFNTIQIGKVKNRIQDKYLTASPENPFCWSDSGTMSELLQYLDNVRSDNDTAGGIVRVQIDNVPVGLGDPVFEKLNANLAKSLFTIGSVKGVSFGSGFDFGQMQGTEANDQMEATGFLSNHSGGISGGISTGQPIIINIAVKAVSSHGNPQMTINKAGNNQEIKIEGRHDVCHIPRIIPVIESMIRLTLADAIAWQKQISESKISLNDYREAIDKLDEDLLLLLYRRKKIVEQVKEDKLNKGIPFRDIEREQKIQDQWIEFAGELGLPDKYIPVLQSLVLQICRDDNSDHTL